MASRCVTVMGVVSAGPDRLEVVKLLHVPVRLQQVDADDLARVTFGVQLIEHSFLLFADVVWPISVRSCTLLVSRAIQEESRRAPLLRFIFVLASSSK
jgi:hypothetical protein